MDPKHYGYNTISEFPSIVPSIYLNPSKLKLWRKPLRSVLKVFLTTYLSIQTENVWLDYILFAQKTLKEIIVFTSWIEKRNSKTGFLQQNIYFNEPNTYEILHIVVLTITNIDTLVSNIVEECVLINMYKILLTYNFKRAVTLFNDQSLL